MSTPLDPTREIRPARSRRRRSNWSLRITPTGLIILLLINLIIILLLGYPVLQARVMSAVSPSPSNSSLAAVSVSDTPFPSSTLSPSPTQEQSPTAQLETAPATPPPPAVLIHQGWILLSLNDGGNAHLYAYQPQTEGNGIPVPLTRLTHGPWDDIHPALSPDGNRLAFASNRNGYWDLYLMDLPTGVVTRLTDSLTYDGAPAWSPDGVWLVYESYADDNLEIMILSVEEDTPPIRLTHHPGADHSPAWSPQGRQIAFVSTRNSAPEIWIADLDNADENRFHNASHNLVGRQAHPAWSPDGSTLAWTAEKDGFRHIYLWDPERPKERARFLGSGDRPTWSPDGKVMLTIQEAPNRAYLTAFQIDQPGLVLPPVQIPGWLEGLAWGEASLPWPLRDPYKQAALLTPTPLWLPALTLAEDVIPNGRQKVVALEDVEAPQASLHDLVDESFQALRQRLAFELGWDFLSTLENAYIPLTKSLDPGRATDWLYTGRAFAFNTVPLNAGWIVVVREDFGSETYWRVYLRARYQDGSAGLPLRDQPWDFGARYSGNTVYYEQGGMLMDSVPTGYWFDFTRLAAAYGWERIPALTTWRSAFPGSRFNQFAFTDGLDWRSAMLELYPPEIFITPSPMVPPTRTPTSTPRWFQTPTPTLSPTPRPTLTPLPPTASPTVTQPPTRTPTSPSTATPSPTAIPTDLQSTATPESSG